MVKAYLTYRRKRLNAHGIHSPFVFEFYNEILKKASQNNCPSIEKLRKSLKQNNQKITVTDLGAGSKHTRQNERSIASIAKHAAISKKYGQLMNRLVEFYKIKNILELGTSLGIGTAYLAQTKLKSIVTTVEGCPEIYKQALKNVKQLGLLNVEVYNEAFEDRLVKLAEKQPVYDLIYIDGNHTYEATLNYFEFAMNHTHDHAFIVFDDIHWNEEMEKAWQKICEAKKINVSMDLFRLGIVLKRPGQRKQHFVLKY